MLARGGYVGGGLIWLCLIRLPLRHGTSQVGTWGTRRRGADAPTVINSGDARSRLVNNNIRVAKKIGPGNVLAAGCTLK